MNISKLRLQYFRCYEQLTLDLPPGRNLFIGPNASGKTSLLEAILLLATTNSPRTTYDRELVQWGRGWGQVAGRFEFDSGSPRAIAVTLQGQGSSNTEGEPPPSYLTGAKCV
ncbi:MAG: AAA family ATPase, partial [Armatimonadetes bacterium]|nr:AAA family ATPase [Armatimonadota bacterium]